MKHYRFKDLEITSAKLPYSTHLWWYHASYGIIMVDSADQTVLLFSTIARLLIDGSDWDIVSLADNTNSYKIQAGWLDGNDLWLVMCDNDATADNVEVCYIELDDSNDCNPVGIGDAGDDNWCYAWDIFKIGAIHYVAWSQKVGVGQFLNIYECDSAPFTQRIHQGWATVEHSHNIIISGSAYWRETDAGGGFMLKYTPDAVFTQLANLVGYTLPTDIQRGLSYDGDDTIYMILNKVADGKDYIVYYSITDDEYTIGVECNLALMLERNCSGTNPTPQEKAFGITGTSNNLLIFELIPNRSYPMQIQDLSTIPSTAGRHIIAITDYYLMLDSGLMFEYTDCTSYMVDCRIHDGILPAKKRFTFKCHPNFFIYWNMGDMINIYDD